MNLSLLASFEWLTTRLFHDAVSSIAPNEMAGYPSFRGHLLFILQEIT
jgi:hypothetical protein